MRIKTLSDLVTHKLYRSDLGRAVEDNLEKFGSQAQGHKALATDTFYFYWQFNFHLRDPEKVPNCHQTLARRYYPVQWQYISGSINTLRVKDIFCFSEITQCSLNDTAFISGGWPGVVDKVCSRTVIIFLSTPVPPPLVWWQELGLCVMMEVSGIFWHLHTIMTLSLVIQYGTLLSPNQNLSTRI